MKLYQEEFIATLINQAEVVSERYNAVIHQSFFSVGDLGLIKVNFTKPHSYQL